jgi:enoyl-CoA hydratase/carnithine racemase
VDDGSPAAAGVRARQDGPVLTVTLDRPASRNAQTPATWRALAAVGDRLPPDVRVVVLRAEGPAFSAGLHRALLTPQGLPDEPSLLGLGALPRDRLDDLLASYQAAFTWWARPDVVSVAAVQGHAVGAGFQLALACDLRVVAHDVRFAMRETSLGLVPDLGGTGPLVRAVGYPRALELCLTGREVGAAEAVDLGLAQLAVPRAELDDAVADLAGALLAPDAGAVRETTALLAGADRRSPDEQLAAERAAQGRRLRAIVRAAEAAAGERPRDAGEAPDPSRR